MTKLAEIPVIHAESVIPPGDACYVVKSFELNPETHQMQMVTKLCPFWRFNQEMATLYGSDQLGGYCTYLKAGDWQDNGTMLLWDQIKECTVKTTDADRDLAESLYLDAESKAKHQLGSTH